MTSSCAGVGWEEHAAVQVACVATTLRQLTKTCTRLQAVQPRMERSGSPPRGRSGWCRRAF